VASEVLWQSRPVPLAWRNLVANKRRLARSVAGIGFAVLLMLVQLGFERGFFDASLGMVRQFDGDLFIMRASKYRVLDEDPFSAADLEAARKVPGVASITPLYATWMRFFWTSPADNAAHLIQAFAFDPDTPVFALPDVRTDSALLKSTDTVIVDRRARDFLGMASGSGDAKINGRVAHIVGSFALGPDFMNDGTVMMSPASFAAFLTGSAASAPRLPVEFGVVRLKPGIDVTATQHALAAALSPQLRVLTKPELVDFERAFQADLSAAGPIFWLGTLVGFVVGMLISYQVIYTDLSDQLPQYATLKGMGYSTFYLVRMVFEQATLSAIAAYVPAWLLCLLVYRIIASYALLPLHMTASQTLLSFALAVGMCLLAAGLAIRRVVVVDPAEVF
jgi:DevC protein